MKKKLMCILASSLLFSSFIFASTVRYYTSCGTSGYTVGNTYFDSEDEYWDYLTELNEIECGSADIPTIQPTLDDGSSYSGPNKPLEFFP